MQTAAERTYVKGMIVKTLGALEDMELGPVTIHDATVDGRVVSVDLDRETTTRLWRALLKSVRESMSRFDETAST